MAQFMKKTVKKLVLQNGNTGMHAQSISQSVQLY